MLIHCNQTHSNCIEINDTIFNKLLCADKQVLLPDSEDDLQTALYT